MASIFGAPPLDQPGFDLQADQSNHVVANFIALITLGTSFVTLRFISRWLAHAGYWWDDLLVFIALLLAIVPSILNIWCVNNGGMGKHIWAVQPSPTAILPKTFKMLYIFQIFFTLATATIKLCTLAFYKRIFPDVRTLRVVLFFVATGVGLLLMASTAVTIFQCSPIHKFWNRQQPGTCMPVQNVLYGLGAINTLLDLLVVLLPIPLLWHLHTSIRQKCLFTGIFLVAGFVCVVSLVRLLLWSNINSSDVTWSAVPVSLWSATEPIASIICACIPSLRPLLTITWHALTLPTTLSTTASFPPQNSLSKANQYQQASVFRREAANKRKIRPVGEDLEEMGKIARGGRPWGSNARAYCGFEEVERGKEDVRIGKIEVPNGRIAVKTDWRISVCSNGWEYMDRVY